MIYIYSDQPDVPVDTLEWPIDFYVYMDDAPDRIGNIWYYSDVDEWPEAEKYILCGHFAELYKEYIASYDRR